jgi:predicted nucleic acid-binding protein
VSRPDRGLLDTSVLIAAESGRQLDEAALPVVVAISPVTLAELSAGVLSAADVGTKAKRLATLDSVADVEVLPIDDLVAAAWSVLRARLAEAGRRMKVNDLWIAATAVANQIPVVTQDDDFDAVAALEVEIVRV